MNIDVSQTWPGEVIFFQYLHDEKLWLFHIPIKHVIVAVTLPQASISLNEPH